MTDKCPTAGPLALLAACLLLAGCGKADHSCPVTGQVLVNGKPAVGLYIVFYTPGAMGQQSPASARTDKDGSFSLRVPDPGEYAVTAFWPSMTAGQGEQVEGEDVLRGRFRHPDRPAWKAVIAAGQNALPPLELRFDFNKP